MKLNMIHMNKTTNFYTTKAKAKLVYACLIKQIRY